jgi:cbb3-type cytochrome oxidase subunit 3
VFLVAAFVLAVAYALWPGNRKGFDRAARRPLEEEAAPIRNDELRK